MLKRVGVCLTAAVIVAVVPMMAQRGGMGMGMMPTAMNGLWNPEVGSGATYDMVDKDGKHQQMTIAVVSKGESEGQSGHWLEYLLTTSDGQQTVMQMLMVKAGAQVTPVRMIVQPAGRGPMEFSASIMGMMAGRGGPSPTPSKADFREGGERVGVESVTTPAGTFECEHWRSKDGANVWISPKAGPWGLVKSASSETSMTILKVITDAKSHIVGTPQSMDSMMGRGRGQE